VPSMATEPLAAAVPAPVLPPVSPAVPRPAVPLEEARPAAERKTVTPYPIISEVGFDEPFEEEYARLIPDRSPDRSTDPERNVATSAPAGASDTDQQAENLDIPAFLRRGNL
jgi:hypothetical protein